MKLAILFSQLLALAFALSARADRLRLDGLSEEVKGDIVKRFPGLAQDFRDFSQVDELVRYLMRTENFQTVEILRVDPGTLQVLATPINKVGSVSFSGNSSVETEELERLINMEAGGRFNQSAIIDLANKVKELYATRGHKNSSIEVSVLRDSANLLNVILKITEGAPTAIREILFESTNPGLNEKLTRTTEKYRRRVLSAANRDSLIGAVRDDLLDHRYLRTKVKDPAVTFGDRDTEAILTFQIDNPYRYEFFISGNTPQAFTVPFLIRQITSSSFSTASKDPQIFVADLIKELYLEKGYALVKVAGTERINSESFRKDILVEIEEGPRVELEKIDLIGLYSRSEKYYADFIRDHSSSLIQSRFYNLNHLKRGIENLGNELKNQGYLNAKIQLIEENFDPRRGDVTVKLSLTEGPLTQIKSISFSGNRSFSDQELLEVVELEANAPFQSNRLLDKIEKLNRFYRDRGFLEMALKNPDQNLVSYNNTLKEVSIGFKIYEGPKVTAKSITVEGNHKTKTEVILRELEFSPGDVLTTEKVIESQNRLFQLGIFSEVRIETLEKNTSVKNRTVVVRVKEGKPQTLRFGAGVTNERDLTVRGYSAYSHNNLFGTARALGLRAELNSNIGDINYPERDLTLSYLERFSFWPRTSLRMSAANSTNVIAIDNSDEQVTVSEKTDFVFQLENNVRSHTKVFFSVYDLSFQKTFEKDGRFEPEENRIAQFGPAIEFDFRDNIFNPRSGSFSRLSLRYADPVIGSSAGIRFFKTTAKTTHYWTAFGKVVWVNSLRGGYLKSLYTEDDGGVPAVTEGFFLGGRPTIRGFHAIDERFPSNSELGVDELKDFVITDESYFGLFKTEFRFPLFASVGGSIFYDGGIVGVKGLEFTDPYRDSIGFGIQIATPVGPINFEFGYKLDRKRSDDPDENEDAWRFHFSIGSF